LRNLAEAVDAPRFVGPDQAELEAIVSSMHAAAA
jgi:hypothetical protein